MTSPMFAWRAARACPSALMRAGSGLTQPFLTTRNILSRTGATGRGQKGPPWPGPKAILAIRRQFVGAVLLSGLLLFGEVGCESDSDNSQSAASASGEPVNLDGTWVIACVERPDVGEDSATRYEWTIDGSRFDYLETWYVATDCASGSEFSEHHYTGNESVGNDTTVEWSDTGAPDGLDDSATASLETGTSETATTTYFGAEGAEYANSVAAFGQEDWEAGVEQDVLGKNFDGSDWDNVTLDLIFIDDTGDDDFWYSGDASTVEEGGHPTLLWPHDPGVRQ